MLHLRKFASVSPKLMIVQLDFHKLCGMGYVVCFFYKENWCSHVKVEKMYSTGEVAKMLGVTAMTIKTGIKLGKSKWSECRQTEVGFRSRKY